MQIFEPGVPTRGVFPAAREPIPPILIILGNIVSYSIFQGFMDVPKEGETKP